MKNRTRAVLGMVLVLVAVLVMASACQAPPQAVPTGPVQVEITNWDAAAALVTGDSAPAEESRAVGNVTTLRSLRVQKDAAVGGDMTVGGTVTAAGTVRGLTPVLLKTANYVSTAADTGAVINTTNAMTITLPAVAVGLNLCVYNGDGADIKIDPNTTNTVLTLTNGNGDRLTNTTVGDSVCLVGLNGTSWMAMERVGTWADGN